MRLTNAAVDWKHPTPIPPPNRTNKRNPRAPDFKQRDGDAALWIQSNNTPDWVHANLPPPRM
jgi:hypothetical protein